MRRPAIVYDLREAVGEQGERISKFRAGLTEVEEETRGLEMKLNIIKLEGQLNVKRQLIANLRAEKAPKEKIDEATKELEFMLSEAIPEQEAWVSKLRTDRADESLRAELLADTWREWSKVRPR